MKVYSALHKLACKTKSAVSEFFVKKWEAVVASLRLISPGTRRAGGRQLKLEGGSKFDLPEDDDGVIGVSDSPCQ